MFNYIIEALIVSTKKDKGYELYEKLEYTYKLW